MTPPAPAFIISFIIYTFRRRMILNFIQFISTKIEFIMIKGMERHIILKKVFLIRFPEL